MTNFEVALVFKNKFRALLYIWNLLFFKIIAFLSNRIICFTCIQNLYLRYKAVLASYFQFFFSTDQLGKCAITIEYKTNVDP